MSKKINRDDNTSSGAAKQCVSCNSTKNVRHQGPRCVNCYRKEINPDILERIKLYQRTKDYNVNDRFNKGKAEAKSRKIKWSLTKEEYYDLNNKQCFYCSGPLPKAGVGLDRISLDKNIGYSSENVVPCCTTCNSIRGDKLSVTETMSAIQAVKESRQKNIENVFERGYDVDNRVLFIFSDIDTESISNALKGLELMESVNSYAPITIKVMSNGGDFYAAMALYDALTKSPCPKITQGMGLVGSAATLLFQAGDKRLLSEHCRFLIHDGEQFYEGQPKSLEAWGRESKKSRAMMYNIYSQKSKKDILFWEKECGKDTIYTAREAIALGLADDFI